MSQQRASKNNLKKHFLDLKRHQGYTVELIDPDETLNQTGRDLAKLGERLIKSKRMNALLHARPLTFQEFQEIDGRLSENEKVTVAEEWSRERMWFERFYRRPLTRSLMKLDNNGKYRQSVLRFENLQAFAKRTHEIAGMTGDLRSKLDISGAAKLDKRFRFLKTSQEVTRAIFNLLHQTPLMKDGNWTPTTLTSDDLKPFSAAILKQKAIVENLLDFEVRADVRSKPMTQLNQLLKLVGLNCKPLKKQKIQGKIVYRYQFDSAAYKRMTALVEKRATTNAWRSVYEMHGWDQQELPEELQDNTSHKS